MKAQARMARSHTPGPAQSAAAAAAPRGAARRSHFHQLCGYVAGEEFRARRSRGGKYKQADTDRLTERRTDRPILTRTHARTHTLITHTRGSATRRLHFSHEASFDIRASLRRASRCLGVGCARRGLGRGLGRGLLGGRAPSCLPSPRHLGKRGTNSLVLTYKLRLI